MAQATGYDEGAKSSNSLKAHRWFGSGAFGWNLSKQAAEELLTEQKVKELALETVVVAVESQ